MIVDPWGLVLAQAPDAETFAIAELDLERQAEIRRTLPSLANRRLGAYRWPVEARRERAAAVDKRRIILDAAVRVFARQGFHTCRVSDIADEARRRLRARLPLLRVQGRGARHAVPGALGRPARGDPRDRRAADIAAREKLHAIASFIVDSYRHDPDLMKVIIVEVTRAANSFGARTCAKIGEAYGLIADIVAQGAGRRRVPRHRDGRSSPRWRSTARSSRC